MRVLVTGGAGFIGSHIVDTLLTSGHEVLVVDDLSTGRRDNVSGAAELVDLDVADPAISKLMMDFRPEVVSHCAAQVSVTASMDDPVHDARINILGGTNVALATIAAGCSELLYINTGGALYGTPDYSPCDEDHPIRPISGYGLSKWVSELYLRLLIPDSMRLKVLRLANVYGPRQIASGEAGVVAVFAERLSRGQEATIFGDGEQTRDFVFVSDVARAHQLALEANESLTVNIGTGEAISVNTLFSVMAAHTGYTLRPVYEAERPGEIKHMVLDAKRANRLLGWTPHTSLQDGLRETLAWTGARLV